MSPSSRGRGATFGGFQQSGAPNMDLNIMKGCHLQGPKIGTPIFGSSHVGGLVLFSFTPSQMRQMRPVTMRLIEVGRVPGDSVLL